MNSYLKLLLAFLSGALACWFIVLIGIEDSTAVGGMTSGTESKAYSAELSNSSAETAPRDKSVEDGQAFIKSSNDMSDASKIKKLEEQVKILNQENKQLLKQLEPSTAGVNVEEQKFYEGVPSSHRNSLNFEQLGTSRLSMTEFHGELSAEAKDVSWALEKEQQITTYLYNHPSAELFVVSRVDCRTTMCEIMVTSHASDNQLWRGVVSQMQQEAWWDMGNFVTIQQPSDEFGLVIMTSIYK